MIRIKRINARLQHKVQEKISNTEKLKSQSVMKNKSNNTQTINNTKIVNIGTSLDTISKEIQRDYRRYNGLEV